MYFSPRNEYSRLGEGADWRRGGFWGQNGRL
jgi:hypothetical protein